MVLLFPPPHPLPLILLLDQKYQNESKKDDQDQHQNNNLSSRWDIQVGLTHYYEISYCFDWKADVNAINRATSPTFKLYVLKVVLLLPPPNP